MASLSLKGEHHASKGFGSHCTSFAQMADIPILTKYAEEITVCHKDGPGTIRSDQRKLFTKMRAVA
jgi:hypothetical protein